MTRMSVERATSEHDALLALAGRLRAMVGGQRAPEPAHAVLREFSTRIEHHRGEEARDLYAPLLAFAEERSEEFGAVLNGMLTRATSDWSTYFERWTRDAIEADWPAFGAETLRVLDSGRARLCLENELLYPLALKHGLVPLRAVTA